MNIENTKRLIETLKTQGDWFAMNLWGRTVQLSSILADDQPENPEDEENSCGTVACIAGYSQAIMLADCRKNKDFDLFDNIMSDSVMRNGMEFLGLTLRQAEDLFVCGDTWQHYQDELGFNSIDLLNYMVKHDVSKPQALLMFAKVEHAIILLEKLVSGEWEFQCDVDFPSVPMTGYSAE